MKAYKAPGPGYAMMVRFDRGEYILESLTELCEKEGINTALITSGIGALDICNIHTNNKINDPEGGDVHMSLKGAVEVGSMQGSVIGGKPHMHIVVDDVNNDKVYAAHFGSGSRASYGISINMIVLEGVKTQSSFDIKTGESHFEWQVD